MTKPLRKKLIEVAVPLQAINKGSEEDKNRKTGHIRNLHKWFAPMPLPAWRAMLFATLVDDPGESFGEKEAEVERARLLGIVERLASFDSYQDAALLIEARREISKSVGANPPVIIDPFCGGGSTLLEAQRLGLPTRASDLNPVPVLITTVLCRAASLFRNMNPIGDARGQTQSSWHALEGFKSDVRYYAALVREEAFKILADHYPQIEGATPFAYRWAWTVRSPDPSANGKHTPLISNWSLSKGKTGAKFIEPLTDAEELSYAIRDLGIVPPPTTGRAAARCLYSKTPIPVSYIREQGRSGNLSTSMFAVAARNGLGTVYYAPDLEQQTAAAAVPSIDMLGIELPSAALGFRVQQYGMHNFLDLFTERQQYALLTFSECVSSIHKTILADAERAGLKAGGKHLEDGGEGALGYADAIIAVLGLCVGKLAQSNNVLVRWFIDPRNGSGKATPAFDRHAIPMVWDFVETNPFGGSVGDWCGPVLETALRAFDLCGESTIPTEVVQQDARAVAENLPPNAMIATDPPYYANIGYADLSDFFYLWLRPSLRAHFPKLFRTMATPKTDELIATPFRHEGSMESANAFFRQGFAQVFGSLIRKSDERFPVVIVYAIKQSEEVEGDFGSTGWEVFIGGLVGAGLEIVATWPVRTTTDTRMIGIGNNALASAIFVVCRKQPLDAPVVSRRQFLEALRAELPAALVQLQKCNIAPVDLAQAAIGPGMAIYTRHARVIDAEGVTVSIRQALAAINEVLDEVLSDQGSDFDPDTRWALTWFDEVGFAEGEYGKAETLSKAKNTSVTGLFDAGIVSSKSGKVRLLKPEELAPTWNREPTLGIQFGKLFITLYGHWQSVKRQPPIS